MAKKVLVVDDDEGILDAISLVLNEAGFEVMTTDRGEETYKKAAQFRPDLILLDILMSGIDGREICKQLKSDPITQHYPVIMVSAHPSAQQTVKSYGANAFLAKPFDTDELTEIVSKYAL